MKKLYIVNQAKRKQEIFGEVMDVIVDNNKITFLMTTGLDIVYDLGLVNIEEDGKEFRVIL